MASVLVVDDEKNIVTSLDRCLSQEGYKVVTATDGASALSLLSQTSVDLAILDIIMPGMNGMDILERVRRQYPKVRVIMISAMGTIEDAVRATKLGAYDFIEKPLSLDKLLLTLKHALEVGELERENLALRRRMSTRYEMIGESVSLAHIRSQIEMAASSHARVLIRGENGTGKELVARALHSASPRKGKPFVEVNCAAIPKDLIESELFGHMKGAFTGADEDRKGRFEEAHEGTLFLDEVGDMSLETQAKVLRCLQEQRIQRVGSSTHVDVDVRIIAATNQDLEEKMASGGFREDLFYRLNVIPIFVPPLRERRDDIPLLSQHFLTRFCQENNKRAKVLEPNALRALCDHDWPGNVRELKNTCERLAIMFPEDRLRAQDVASVLGPGKAQEDDLEQGGDLKSALARFERRFIERVVERHRGNVSDAAVELGVERSLVYKKLKRINAFLKEEA